MSKYNGIGRINIKVRDATVRIIVDSRLPQGRVEIKGRGGRHASGDLLSIDYESPKRGVRPMKGSDWKWNGWRPATSCTVVSDSGPKIVLTVAPGTQYRTFKFA